MALLSCLFKSKYSFLQVIIQDQLSYLKMSQKKKNKEAEALKDKWNKEEDPLQAVVVADSFNSKFLPITVERPRVRQSGIQNRPIFSFMI